MAVLLAGGSGFAQQTRSAPAPDAQNAQAGQPEQGPSPQAKQRLFKLIPIEEVGTQNDKPLSSKEKLALFFHGVSVLSLVPPLLVTGFSEALLDNSGFGWGPAGFGKHYGAALADQVSSHLLGIWAFPSLFHQDPRYFPKQSGGFGSRIGYSVSRVVITRADNGDRQINYSRLAAALTSSTISNSYYPEGHRGISHTATTTSVSLGITAGFNVLREFLPDINRLTTKGRRKAATCESSGSERPQISP